jgi:hypothetical protein
MKCSAAPIPLGPCARPEMFHYHTASSSPDLLPSLIDTARRELPALETQTQGCSSFSCCPKI